MLSTLTQNLCLQLLQTYLLITLLAANAPQSAIDTALLVPLINLTFVLLHLGQRIAVSIGLPQFGQECALLLTSFPHSEHFISAIIFSSGIFKKFNYLITFVVPQ